MKFNHDSTHSFFIHLFIPYSVNTIKNPKLNKKFLPLRSSQISVLWEEGQINKEAS